MKKGLIIAVVALLVLAVAVPVAMAALTDSQRAELEGLYRQQHELRQRIFQKQTEFGLVDGEKAEVMRERMEQMWEARQQQMEEGNFSFGRMGRRGVGGPRGAGGCGNCPVDNNGPEL